MSDTFTKEQCNVVQEGYAAIADACDRQTHEYAIRLREALAYERKGRFELYAKALICDQFTIGMVQGCGEYAMKPASLFTLSPGLMMAHCMGAAIGKRLSLTELNALGRDIQPALDALTSNRECRAK